MKIKHKKIISKAAILVIIIIFLSGTGLSKTTTTEETKKIEKDLETTDNQIGLLRKNTIIFGYGDCCGIGFKNYTDFSGFLKNTDVYMWNEIAWFTPYLMSTFTLIPPKISIKMINKYAKLDINNPSNYIKIENFSGYFYKEEYNIPHGPSGTGFIIAGMAENVIPLKNS